MNPDTSNPNPDEYALAPDQAAVPMATPAPLLAYAVPTAYQQNVAGSAAWQEGNTLVVLKGTYVCDRCVKCGQPAAGGPIKRTLYWHPWGYYLIILIGLPLYALGVLLYVLVALMVREKGTVFVGLCAAHRKRRLIGLLSAWTLALGGIALMCSGAINPPRSTGGSSSSTVQMWFVLGGMTMLLGGIVVGFALPIVRARKIDQHYIWLRGAGREFLATLPGIVR